MISIPGKNMFSTSFPSNGAKDVYAKNCFQTSRKKANIISNISIKQNWVFRVFLGFLFVNFGDKMECIHNLNKK